jgi:rod shape-determining protein MreC
MFIRLQIRKLLFYTAVIGLLVFLYSVGALKIFENAAAKAMNPLLSMSQNFGVDIGLKFGGNETKAEIKAENENLKNENAKLTEENAGYRILEQENSLLRESLGFLSRNKYKYMMANVISRGEIGDLSGHTEAVTIDKGGRDGLKDGLAVVDDKGVMVGKIASIKDNSSLVYLVNNSQCKIAVSALNDQNTSGVIEGELGLTTKMSFIPQNKQINPGDIIVTSGLEEYIPRGLVIGRVKTVNKESNELWQWAEIEPMIDPDNLIIASVLIP